MVAGSMVEASTAEADSTVVVGADNKSTNDSATMAGSLKLPAFFAFKSASNPVRCATFLLECPVIEAPQ
jgi:hypothetical protein